MVTRNLWKALDNYCWSEFEEGCDNDNFKDLSAIGIAYTEIYDENDYPYHSMQINLNLPKSQFEYYLDDNLIYTEKHKSEKDIVYRINHTDFQGWYGDFLEYCPEDYH